VSQQCPHLSLTLPTLSLVVAAHALGTARCTAVGKAAPILVRRKEITGSQEGVSVAGIAKLHSKALQVPQPLGQTMQQG
jgi:protein-disulfide isomerase